MGGKPLTAAAFKGYLTKYAPNGKEILWRYLSGGNSNTVPHAVALNPSGNVWVCGTTGARDLPLVNPFQDKQTGLDIAFLMKFSPEGKLLFSTLFGGERNDSAQAIAVDSQGSAYIAGRATSTKLPVKNALQPAISAGGQDAFIAKFSNDGQLEYATYLGAQAEPITSSRSHSALTTLFTSPARVCRQDWPPRTPGSSSRTPIRVTPRRYPPPATGSST